MLSKIKFFLVVLISFVVIIINNIDTVNASYDPECCYPKTIDFRPEEHLTCKNFPHSIKSTNIVKWKRYYKLSSQVCSIKLCNDGKIRDYCSSGKCDCGFFGFLGIGCKDNIGKCYGDYDSVYDAFENVWLVNNPGVKEYIGRSGEIFKINSETENIK